MGAMWRVFHRAFLPFPGFPPFCDTVSAPALIELAERSS